MKVVIPAEKLKGVNSEAPTPIEITLSEVGTRGWVRLDIDGYSYDIPYAEFRDAARAICPDYLEYDL